MRSEPKMTTLRLTIDLDYDADIMHGHDAEGRAWFFDEVLRGPHLLLHDNGNLGDTIGPVRVVEVGDAATLDALTAERDEAADCAKESAEIMRRARDRADALTAEVAALKVALRMAVDEWWERIELMENAVESYLAQTDADNPAREALAYPCCAVTAEPGMRDLLARINTLLGEKR